MFSLVPPKMLNWLRTVLWLKLGCACHFFFCVTCRSLLVGDPVLCLRIVFCEVLSSFTTGLDSIFGSMWGEEASELSILARTVFCESYLSSSANSHFSTYWVPMRASLAILYFLSLRQRGGTCQHRRRPFSSSSNSNDSLSNCQSCQAGTSRSPPTCSP